MKYGHNSDYRQGERDFERSGRYGYDEKRYLGYSKDDRDYQGRLSGCNLLGVCLGDSSTPMAENQRGLEKHTPL